MITHILLDCSFTREVWDVVCSALGRPEWVPQSNEQLNEWCAARTGSCRPAKNARAVLILTMWSLWKHRNAIVFDEVAPSKMLVISAIESEARSWSAAGLLKGDVQGFLGSLARWVFERG